MKKLFALLLALLTALSLSATAFADILWSPTDNPFFDAHRKSCDLEERSYYANGREGFVTLWDAPGGSTVRTQYENGEKLWVRYTYKDWALVSYGEVLKGTYGTGWVPLSDLYLIYDHISFEEEYGDQFRDYNGEFADYEAEVGDEFWFWEYPHAGEPREIRKITQNMLDGLLGTWEIGGPAISKVYTDQNGQDWGYVEWLWGDRDFWLLLDNPTGDGIMTSCISEVDILLDSGEIIPPREPVMPGVSYTPYVLVGVVVIVTGCLLVIFYKKKK